MASLTSFKLVNKRLIESLQERIATQDAEITSATAFIKEMEKGNLENLNSKNVDANSLTGSLVTMGNKMKTIAQDEKERNWVAEGLALFSDILRSHSNDLRELSDHIISELVKYMQANQGALYLVNNNNPSDVHIELISCYAYDRKKYSIKRIELGEGMLGQTALEKATLYMTEVPTDYVKITSGLGEALPRNIVIVPLKLEDEVYGLVELASFHVIRRHQLNFVEKLSETLASTIAAVKTAERTQRLLKESQIQAEQLRSQEEEVRQNMEELSSTQEEMQRVLKEVERKEKEISDLLNASNDVIATVNRSFQIQLFNKAFADTFKRANIARGTDYLSLFSIEEQARRKSRFLDAFEGKRVDKVDHIKNADGTELYYRVRCVPMLDINTGMAHAVAVYATDVSELYLEKTKAERLANEAQQQTEEARAQEEEIRQNMEELQAIQDEMKRVNAEVERNEKEVSALLDTSTDSILTLDKEFRVIRFNRVFASSFNGLKVEKGLDILTMFDEEAEKTRKKAVYNQAFEGKVVESIDHISIGGHDLYFKVTHSPLTGADGTITSIAIFASNITELQRSKEQAEQKEKAISELINVSSDSILTIDKDFKVVQYNDIFAKSLGGFKVEIGFDLMALFSAAEQKAKKELYNRVFAGETVELIDHSELNGIEMYYKVKHAPMHDVDGNISTIALYASDVTELYKAKHEAEEKARQAMQQMEELRAQEEEIRQNLEELQAIQEDLSRKNQEMEKIKAVERDRADVVLQSHKNNMRNIMTKFKELESGYKARIAELEKKVIAKK
ncbi:PAS domain-containing protein [Chryseolinea sp. T2]|uniref:PAS domain-containing protein n=1 Tax=Chryseolinea sp. T2 TaxID=3129255 RepID=UPI0030773B10